MLHDAIIIAKWENTFPIPVVIVLIVVDVSPASIPVMTDVRISPIKIAVCLTYYFKTLHM
jgi:hypothetical protein